MLERLKKDLPFLQNKYHNSAEPFNAFHRMAYHGWPGDPDTGYDDEEMDAFLRKLLSPYVGKLNALVLGCTHYPFASDAISRIMGEDTVLLDGGEGTARNTRRRLAEAGLLREEGEGCVVFENSAEDPVMLKRCEQLLRG